MKGKAQSNYHPQLYQYLRRYQEDPSSRVFAPLAEAYRKAGLIDEAIEIAREGLKNHPNFLGGRVALARALFDKKLYQEVVDELAPVVQDIPDNLVAQRLLAESYLILGRVAESLSAYKMLLYFSPQDTETARIVQELEAQAYEKGTLVLRTDPAPVAIPEFDVRPANSAIEADPDQKRAKKIKNIEKLQSLLQRVERYKVLREVQSLTTGKG
jgi:tetratricopeptide (TPR) repeat protein